MALPDYSDLIRGATVTWKNSGGDKTLTLTSLTNGSGREGDKSATLIDGTYGMPELLEWFLLSAVGTTVTSTDLELYLGFSDSSTAGTNNPGNLAGADGAWSTPDELKLQLALAGCLNFSNGRTTNIQKVRLWYPRPAAHYVIPALVNKTGQTLSGTASDHQLIMTPLYRRILD